MESVLIQSSLNEKKRKMNDIDLSLLMRFPNAFGRGMGFVSTVPNENNNKRDPSKSKTDSPFLRSVTDNFPLHT